MTSEAHVERAEPAPCNPVDLHRLTLLGGALELGNFAAECRDQGEPASARAAYRALWTRHPGTVAASLAAFELGRLFFASDMGESRRWFRRYLTEAEDGSLTRETMGRLLELSDETTPERELANQYLTRFPTGPHARLAAQIVRHDR